MRGIPTPTVAAARPWVARQPEGCEQGHATRWLPTLPAATRASRRKPIPVGLERRTQASAQATEQACIYACMRARTCSICAGALCACMCTYFCVVRTCMRVRIDVVVLVRMCLCMSARVHVCMCACMIECMPMRGYALERRARPQPTQGRCGEIPGTTRAQTTATVLRCMRERGGTSAQQRSYHRCRHCWRSRFARRREVQRGPIDQLTTLIPKDLYCDCMCARHCVSSHALADFTGMEGKTMGFGASFWEAARLPLFATSDLAASGLRGHRRTEIGIEPEQTRIEARPQGAPQKHISC